MSDPRTDPTRHPARPERDRPSYWFRGLIVAMIAVVVAAPLVGMRSLLFSLAHGSGTPHTVVADNQLSPSAGSAGDGQLVAMPSATPSRSPSASPSPSPSASPSRPPHRRTAAPSASSSAGAQTSRAAMTADYTTTNSWSSGFNGEVRVTNVGDRRAGWTVVIYLPRGATATNVWGGADGEQSGRAVTFTPANGDLAPGDSITFDFQVQGASGPTGCSIDGDACD